MATAASDLILKSAMEYASRGWRVVPLQNGAKHPNIIRWHVVATTDEEKIVEWWEGKYKGFGIFVVFGPQSGIIDVDLDDWAHDKMLVEAFGGDIPITCSFISGTKKTPHRLFKFRDDLPEQSNINLRHYGIGIDADIKTGYGGKGSGSVFPPSFGTYSWLPELSPDRCDVADLPDQFVAWLHNSMDSGGSKPKKRSARQSLYEVKEVLEGRRDETIYAEACALWREQSILHGAGCFDSPDCEVAVYERLWNANRARCRPALEDSEIRKKCDGARQFISTQTVYRDERPKLTSLGLEYRNGEWWPGEWYVEVIRCDPRRARTHAPFLPKKFVEMALDDFDSPVMFHRCVLAETGTVCLAYKPGFWPSVWNGSKIKDAVTGKPRVTTGLKAKLLREAKWIEAPREEQREAVIAQRVLDCLRRAGPPRKAFEASCVTAPVRDDEGNIWFRFNSVLESLATSEDKITRNELSQCVEKFADQVRVRGPGGRTRVMAVKPSGIKDLETIAHGEEDE